MFKKLLALLVLNACLSTLGCNYIAPIGPIIQLGIMWYEGEAQKYYATPQEKLHVAVKQVLNELTLPIIEERVDGETIYIQAGDDDKFKIKITSVRENVSKLSIRVNLMGDKPYAELIYRHVDKMPNVEQFASLAELNTAVEKQPRRFRR
jgi:hypothetical protein